MPALIIACLSQKGGVGKSTIARLIAQTYAAGGWSVKIADFNTRQHTSLDWVSIRDEFEIEPRIQAASYVSPTAMKREDVDLVVADGRPDSDQSSLDIAHIATLNVLPTGLTLDDLKPQLMFAHELLQKGVPHERLMFVLNKTGESELALQEARQYLSLSRIYVAEQDLTAKIGYQMAQNIGRAASESKYPTLNERAEALAANIVDRVNLLTGEAVA